MKARQFFSTEEIQMLRQKSNFRASLEILHTWGWIAFAFALAGFFPNVVTILIALFILGGKQLACAIIMHDASHNALFTSKKANEWIGNWLGAYPVFHSVEQYRPYHLQHHLHTGSDQDPDLALTRGYPASAASIVRKFLRDLFGATGLKGYIGVFAMHLGFLKYSLGGEVIALPPQQHTPAKVALNAWQHLRNPLLAQFFLAAILWLCGAAWLYLLWPAALLTTYNFCIRVRAMAEHSMVPNRHNPTTNTRTTYANWLERMLFAPHHVNYHVEHHLLMSIPPYNYPKMHQMLKNKGFYDNGGLLVNGYWQIIKMAVAKPPITHAQG
ncbi:fatty acid desaturase [Sphingobacteriales bacterium UPWRP_1]|nr:hypothetical protein BVG80_07570 [Sphingobacteriales bacterium TSM_CSM]PSJ72297.1 fatty acid desaturase [Sphingobacteriales bacterium UPWRP_1]